MNYERVSKSWTQEQVLKQIHAHPKAIPVERRAPATKSGADVVMDAGEESGSGSKRGWSDVSDNSLVTQMSVASDQNRFDTACEASEICLRNLTLTLRSILKVSPAKMRLPGVKLTDGQEKLRELVHWPCNWPLARLAIPLEGLSKQIDRLLEGYCFQILATNRDRTCTIERSSRQPRN